jgi:AbrB family looped-hinge helix DNA binding protein
MTTDTQEYGATYTVRIRDRGQITIPQAVRENLAARSGDMLTLVQIGDAYVLTRKELQIPKLADKIAAEMERSGITLADLLEGLEEERQAIWEERQQNAA